MGKIAGPDHMLAGLGLPFDLWLKTESKPRALVLAETQVFYDEFGAQPEAQARENVRPYRPHATVADVEVHAGVRRRRGPGSATTRRVGPTPDEATAVVRAARFDDRRPT
jgi:hypothetical protein